MSTKDETKQILLSGMAMLPLRDVVVFPGMVIPLFVGRDKSVAALEQAMEEEKNIFLVTQKTANIDDPEEKDIYKIGTVSTVLQLLKLPDGTVKVLIEGDYRAEITEFIDDENVYRVQIEACVTTSLGADEDEEALSRVLLSQFEKFAKQSKKIPAEIVTSVNSIQEPGKLADTIASHLLISVANRQQILELLSENKRLEHIIGVIESEMDVLQIEKKIRTRVKQQMEKSQREYYLNEQMKAIQKEMGELDDAPNELAELENKIKSSGMSKEAEQKSISEWNKLKLMSPMSAEATVVRTFIDWMVSIPWIKRSKIRHDLKKAKDILDADHYGLEEVKERILEYLAVQKRVRKLKGAVLCLVGPPGVGKTSLGRSIARATNRKYVRMSLGGVRDESEIRGHRRTYIGSMPGKILQKLAKVGARNPLFLFDEIDKMGMDFRGDPASAMLEVLDPEQNNTFNDHYLEVDYDLSEVMFVCTANSMEIPPALMDRMEVIRLPGYTEDEKLNIACKYLVPKQRKNSGLKEKEVEITDSALLDLIRYYTKEAGVRGLEREIAKIFRKIVKRKAMGDIDEFLVTISVDDLEDYSGVRKCKYGIAEKEDRIGQVTGLAWTQVGGELLTIEAAIVQGKGKIIKTGSLGDVMQESIHAALTVVRSRSKSLGINPDLYDSNDIHIHVPEGAIPKDGPSAGVGMCTVLVSVFANIPIKADVAMTGEITLHGQVLPIGGLKEKLLAARRGGITTVIIPEENVRDLKEIPDNIKEHLDIKPVGWIDQVLDIALQYSPEPIIDENSSVKGTSKKNTLKKRISTH